MKMDHDFLRGGGEMGALMRAKNWSVTPLGAPETWSPTLRTIVRFLLANRFPLLLWWGPRYVSIYNDAYRPVLGTKHPKALGQPGNECWSEIWHVLQPLVDTPFQGGPATWNDDIFLEINRYGFIEETHFTIAYSAVPDEAAPGGIGGVLATVHEITEKVVGERRIVALRDLGAGATQAKSAEQACAVAARTLCQHARDVPFALIYLIDADGKRACLAGAAGVAPQSPASQAIIEIAGQTGEPPVWPLAGAMSTQSMQIAAELARRLGEALPPGPWSDPPGQAVIVPIRSNVPQQLAGFLVAGVSARLKLDELYRSFFELVASQIATAIAGARAYEEEKKRAEALAEIDRAKTVFFSNVSHEFRTPLTLMLGPIEGALANAHGILPPGAAKDLEVSHRNALRLLKLVNTLLDFSRIEAGRIQALYQPTDLAALTAELASNFRSACEKAALRLVVSCPPLPATESVYVDRDMWEQIVLNLMSNAFKFTFEGEIEIRLDAAGPNAQLTVRDTGVGIPSGELPRMFERFHRVRNVRARTHEGTGIGVALVHELAKLHGGAVRVESVLGEGSTFTVTIPFGKAHLDPQRIGKASRLASTAVASSAFVEEALRWLPQEEGQDKEGTGQTWPPSLATPAGDVPASEAESGRPRVLWADDNADMREYVSRLLGGRFDVQAVVNGQDALDAARAHPPDLVLADVMMPVLDGFGLLRALRADPQLREIPIILLSARAGEESRIEGMEVGADDYLIKPFSARELLARVESHVRMARVRREAEESLRAADRRKDEFLATLAHELRNPLAPIRNALHVLRMTETGPSTHRLHEMMERQVNQMVRLVDDLLEVSRITRGTIALQKERVEAAALVRGALETSRPLIEAAGHEFTVALPSTSLTIEVDPVRFAQVIANLINNAAKYTEPGGRIWISVHQEAQEGVISVRDSGIGIAPGMLPRVFEMFTQIERDHKRAQGGLGIGLALVKRLVEMHGGRIQAHSAGPDQGSEFTLHVPLAPARSSLAGAEAPGPEAFGPEAYGPEAYGPEASGAEGSGPDTQPRVPRLRILVVDDNQDAASSLAMLLGLLGSEVETANDGEAGLRLMESYCPSIVLLDLGMPGMSGYEVARRMRERPHPGKLTLVALTGWGQEEDRRRTHEATFDHHLVKPVDLSALTALLAEIQAEPVRSNTAQDGHAIPHSTSLRPAAYSPSERRQ